MAKARMNVGFICPLPPPPPAVCLNVAVLAREAERLGFESIWVPDHPVAPVHVTSYSPTFEGGQVPGFLDPFVSLGMASAVTSSIKLGTGVVLVPERNPILMAKEIATLDHYSGGRFLFGIGAGWNQQESEILGVDFAHRWTQTGECVQVLKALWTKDVAEHHGKYYHFPGVRSFPKPAQDPHPPILLGGWAPSVHRRIVEYGNGWMPHRATPEKIVEGRQALDEMAREAGRDPESIEVTVFNQPADRDTLRSFEETGAERITVGLEIVEDEKEALARMKEMARELLD